METPPTGIVIGFDGSEDSISALRYTLALAERLAVHVQVIVAWRWPTAWGPHPAATGDGWSPERDAQEIGREAVAVAAAHPAVAERVAVHTVHGPAADVLVDAAAQAELLVVGSRGRGGFRGMLLGSVSTACAQYAACPVLVFHDRRPESEAVSA
jgi:nucleotide-binding universal stress UspA family protein